MASAAMAPPRETPREKRLQQQRDALSHAVGIAQASSAESAVRVDLLRTELFTAEDGLTRAASLVANSQSMIRPVERVTARGFEMFQSRAYVHQYTKFGLEEEDFLGAFAQLEDAIGRYKGLR